MDPSDEIWEPSDEDIAAAKKVLAHAEKQPGMFDFIWEYFERQRAEKALQRKNNSRDVSRDALAAGQRVRERTYAKPDLPPTFPHRHEGGNPMWEPDQWEHQGNNTGTKGDSVRDYDEDRYWEEHDKRAGIPK